MVGMGQDCTDADQLLPFSDSGSSWTGDALYSEEHCPKWQPVVRNFHLAVTLEGDLMGGH